MTAGKDNGNRVTFHQKPFSCLIQ